MRERIDQSKEQQGTLAVWALGSVGSARRLLRDLGRYPDAGAALNELVLAVHAVRCYAGMAGLERVRALAERLEDDMCAARDAGAPVKPIWLESVARQLEAIRSSLAKAPESSVVESVTVRQH